MKPRVAAMNFHASLMIFASIYQVERCVVHSRYNADGALMWTSLQEQPFNIPDGNPHGWAHVQEAHILPAIVK